MLLEAAPDGVSCKWQKQGGKFSWEEIAPSKKIPKNIARSPLRLGYWGKTYGEYGIT